MRQLTRWPVTALALLFGVVACGDTSMGPTALDAPDPSFATSTSSGSGYEVIRLGGTESQAVELNGLDVVVGLATLDLEQHAVYWTVDGAGTVTGPVALGIPGTGLQGVAIDVNDAGHVVALDAASNRGFVYDLAADALTELSRPDGAVGATPQSINAGDVVAGNAFFEETDGSRNARPVVWTTPFDTTVPPTLLPLPTDHHSTCAQPVPLNDDGVIVGFSATEDGTCRTLRWTLAADGTVSGPELFGPTNFFARRINDAGQLAGFTSAGSGSALQAVVVEPDGSTIALDPLAGDPQATALGIDDPALDRPLQVAGTSDTWGDDEKAVVWTLDSGGTPFAPAVLPVEECGATSRAAAVNPHGWVAGEISPPATEETVAALWRPVSDGGAGHGCVGRSHIGDLDGSTTEQGGTWTALVDALVLDDTGNPVGDATVSGSWSDGARGSASCVTAADGRCTVSVDGIRKRTKSVTWTAESVTHADLAYDASANTDPDGDSDGTTITVTQGDTSTDDGGGDGDDGGSDCVPKGPHGNNCK